MPPVKREGTKEPPEGSSKRLCTPAIRQQFGRDCSIQAGEDEIAGGVPYVVHVRRRGTAKGNAPSSASRGAPSSSSRDTPTANPRPPSRVISSGKSEDPIDLTDESLLGKREESPLHIDLTWDEEDERKPTSRASVPPPSPSIPPSGAAKPSSENTVPFSRTAVTSMEHQPDKK